LSMHGDRCHAHARKFKHELLLRMVRMRTESKTRIVQCTVHARTVYSKKTILACRARARKTMGNKQIYTVHACTWNLAPNTYAPCARTNHRPQMCSTPCAYW